MGSLRQTYFIFFLLGLQIVNLHAQGEIPWKQHDKLSWSDFKGVVPVGSSAAATTASGISYDFSTINDGENFKMNFRVHAYFYPLKSWYKPKVCNEVTLLHEQLHFDITELYARKMYKQLSGIKFTKNIEAEVRKIYRRTLRQLNDFQNKYDAETNYSRNLPVQERWILEIEEALQD